MQFSWEEARAELAKRREIALQHGGPDAVARQRAAGRGLARERIDQLVDADSFTEIGTLAQFHELDEQGNKLPPVASSAVVGLAQIDQRPVVVASQDFTVGAGGGGKLDRDKGGMLGGFAEDLALEYKLPILYALEGVGGGVSMLQAGGHALVVSSHSWEKSFQLMQEVPVLAAVPGPAAGGVAGKAVLTHFSVITRKTGVLFAGGPPVVRRALGRDINKFELGGAEMHTQVSGAIDNIAEDEADAMRQMRTVLSYLPQNVWELPPIVDTGDPVDRRCDDVEQIVPMNRRRVYDARKLIQAVVDQGSFFEIGPDWGKAVRLGFARIGGRSIGVISSNPMHVGGALDGQAADKQTRFIEVCDTFHLPLVYFVDCPGFMIGPDAERGGVVRKGMRAIQALLEADVPVITIHTRKAYGMAVQATNNPHKLGLRLAWPSAEWGDMPVEGGVEAAFRRAIAAAPDPDAYRAEIEARLLLEASPWKTAEAFGVEEMIEPGETRIYIARFLEAAEGMIRSKLGIRPRYGPRI
jgi:acetyl-CoA carboxylase carboxyltransferase component